MEGIGIHVTIDMAGGVKLGPDVTYLESNDYDFRVTPAKQEAFWRSARKFLPFLEFDDLVPEMAGIRPKTQKRVNLSGLFILLKRLPEDIRA